MNNLPVVEYDLFRWIGGIAVILDYLANDTFFAWVAAAVAVMAALRLFCWMYRGDGA